MNETYTKHQVVDILASIYDNFDLKNIYEDKAISEGEIKDYDNVDAISQRAFDIFLEAFL